MAFLMDAWYIAGWASDLDAGPVGRVFLGEPVLLYRKEDGKAVALSNRCPHRFAPLSMGKVKGNSIQCPYHGLEFGPDGVCTHNPHGDCSIPKAARVKAYPLEERQGALWIWMGNAEKADPSAIVDIGEVDGRPGYATVRGHLMVKGHYELMSDNLLDLSHVPFLHPFLSFSGKPPEGFRVENELVQDGNTVWSKFWNYKAPVSPLFAMLWDGAPQTGTMRAHMRWDPPCTLYLDVGMSPDDGPESEGVAIPIVHLLVPETENSTHYFWAQARNRKIEDEGISAAMAQSIDEVFRNEDERMIEACAQMMGTTDLMSLKPVLLPGDAPAIRARRVLSALIENEQKASVILRSS